MPDKVAERRSLQPPAFDPVPVRPRRDGWTPERQRRFIAALAECRCVHRAVKAVGLSRESAYCLRRKSGAESFAAAWDAILAARPVAPANLSLLWHRAFYGTLKPIVRQGQVVAYLHAPDNRALMSLLRRMEQAAGSSARMRALNSRRGSSR